MAPTRDRHAQMPALVRAFQTDPAWYEQYWYRDRPPAAAARPLGRAL